MKYEWMENFLDCILIRSESSFLLGSNTPTEVFSRNEKKSAAKKTTIRLYCTYVRKI